MPNIYITRTSDGEQIEYSLGEYLSYLDNKITRLELFLMFHLMAPDADFAQLAEMYEKLPEVMIASRMKDIKDLFKGDDDGNKGD